MLKCKEELCIHLPTTTEFITLVNEVFLASDWTVDKYDKVMQELVISSKSEKLIIELSLYKLKVITNRNHIVTIPLKGNSSIEILKAKLAECREFLVKPINLSNLTKEDLPSSYPVA